MSGRLPTTASSHPLNVYIPMVAHEMLTSLQILRGVLQEFPQKPIAHGNPKRFLRPEIEHLSRLVWKILKLHQQGAKKTKLKLKKTNLLELFRSEIEIFRSQAASGVIFQNPLPNSLPIKEILIDPEEMQEVLRVLLENAVKYTPEGGSILCRIMQNHEATFLIVENTGVGMSPEDIQSLIKPYARGDHKTLGFGLGFAIAHHITHLHKGEVEVKSDGQTFNHIQVKIPHLKRK